MMATVTRIAAVASPDAAPFVFGIRHDAELRAGLTVASPTETIRLFRSGAADFALLPVSAIPHFAGAEPATGFCLGSHGAVRTAVLAGPIAPAGARHILYDPEAPAETLLAAYLYRRHWRTAPLFVPRPSAAALPGEEELLLLAGDEALGAPERWPHVCDLGAEWSATTHQPFAFAVWVGRPGCDPDAALRLQRALTYGVEHTYEALLAGTPAERIATLYDHLSREVDYLFDLRKEEALRKLWNAGVRVAPQADPG